MSRTRRVVENLANLVRAEAVENVYIVTGTGINFVAEQVLKLEPGGYEIVNLNEEYGVRERDLRFYRPSSFVLQRTGLSVRIKHFGIVPRGARNFIPIYFVEEPRPTPLAKRLYAYFASMMRTRDVSTPEKLFDALDEIASSYNLTLDEMMRVRDFAVAVYYFWRDTFAYGPLEPVMEDPYIEDITWISRKVPLEVVDKTLSNIVSLPVDFVPSNIIIDPREFKTKREQERAYEEVVNILLRFAGKSVTYAYPILEAMIPDPDPTKEIRHRLELNSYHVANDYQFTIRKFPVKKLSLVHLIMYKTLSPLIAALFIVALIYRRFILVVGGTAGGKTTLMQAIISALPPGFKIFTIEDTPELQANPLNWQPHYIRRAPRGSDILDYDYIEALKVALRNRPAIVTLGEARGAETRVLMQAPMTGHGGIATFHAETPDTLFARLTSPPIELDPSTIDLIDYIAHVGQATVLRDGRPVRVRRLLRVYEVRVENRSLSYYASFIWNKDADEHEPRFHERFQRAWGELVELWRRSRKTRKLGYVVYQHEAAKILLMIYILARILHEFEQRGIVEPEIVVQQLTPRILDLPAKTEEVYERLDARVRRDIRRLSEEAVAEYES